MADDKAALMTPDIEIQLVAGCLYVLRRGYSFVDYGYSNQWWGLIKLFMASLGDGTMSLKNTKTVSNSCIYRYVRILEADKQNG